MFYKPSKNQFSKSTLHSEKMQDMVVKLDENNEELMSGGGRLPIIVILQSVDNQPEAEGKIRGTLLLSL